MWSKEWLVDLIVRVATQRPVICGCHEGGRSTLLPEGMHESNSEDDLWVSFKCEDCERPYIVLANPKTGNISWNWLS